jgi:hypothetical protein
LSASYYIYYRSAAAAQQIRGTVGAMQAALARETGVAGRLLRGVDDSSTWMEIYESVADRSDFETKLAAAVDRFGLESLLAAGAVRHVERFTRD